MISTCYIGIGSNLGDRRKNIKVALQKIKELKDTKIIKISRIIETEPHGVTCRQGKFLNAAAKIQTAISPRHLLRKLQDIEIRLGRPKRHARLAARTIDLDILFYGDRIIDSRDLKIPHPKAFEREFVVRSLLEII